MLLLDLDPLVYACGFAAQKNTHQLIVEDADGNVSEVVTDELSKWKRGHKGWTVLDDKLHVKPVTEREARAIFKQAVAGVVADRPYRAFLTHGIGNFRDKLAVTQPYKGNRKAGSRPVHHGYLRQVALKELPCDLVLGMEADDAISIHAHQQTWPGAIVVSIDKDLDQIPGPHYNYTKAPEEALYTVTPEQGTGKFIEQWLTGDNTDHIRGVKGLGPRGAAEIMKRMSGKLRKDIAAEVVSTYIAAKQTPAEAYETAKLVYMLRAPGEPWDLDKWTRGEQ